MCPGRVSGSFDEEVDNHSREYREDDYESGGVASKQSGGRTSDARTTSKASFQWPERGQPAAGEKKVSNKVLCEYNNNINKKTKKDDNVYSAVIVAKPL